MSGTKDLDDDDDDDDLEEMWIIKYINNLNKDIKVDITFKS